MTQVAQAFGVADRQIERMRRLLRLVKPLQDLVSSGKIGLKAGADLSAGLDEQQQTSLWHQILQASGQPDCRMTEEMARGYVASIKTKSNEQPSEMATIGASVINIDGHRIDDGIEVTTGQGPEFFSEIESTIVPGQDVAMVLSQSAALSEVRKAMRMVERIRT